MAGAIKRIAGPAFLWLSAFTRSDWMTYGFPFGPAYANTSFNDTHGATKASCPLSQCHRLAVVCDQAVSSSVIGLFSMSRPAAIILAIRAVVIDAFDSVFCCRSRSHVVIKDGKVIQPFIRHPDAASSIAMERFVRRAITASLGVTPHVILRRLSQAVSGVNSTGDFIAQATATVAFVGPDVGDVNQTPCATLAPEPRITFFRFRFHRPSVGHAWSLRHAPLYRATNIFSVTTGAQ